jgi:hypothetical protein
MAPKKSKYERDLDNDWDEFVEYRNVFDIRLHTNHGLHDVDKYLSEVEEKMHATKNTWFEWIKRKKSKRRK